MKTAISKRIGIENLVSGYSPGKVEEKKPLLTKGNMDPLLLEYFSLYQYLLPLGGIMLEEHYRNESVLNPKQINQLVQLISPYESNHYFNMVTGYFLTEQISRSYHSEYNDFLLHSSALSKVGALVSFIRGQESNPLRLSVYDAGMNCCSHTSNLIVEVFGKAQDNFGIRSKDSEFTFHGDVSERCCRECYATVKTTNPENVDKLLRNVEKVIFIHEDGSEEEIINGN